MTYTKEQIQALVLKNLKDGIDSYRHDALKDFTMDNLVEAITELRRQSLITFGIISENGVVYNIFNIKPMQ